MKEQNRTIRIFLPLLSALILLLLPAAGCTRPAPPETESYQASESAGDTAPDESAGLTSDPQEIQDSFDAFTDRVFCDLLEDDPLSIHFILQNPENYGLTVTEMKFPEVSLAAMQEDADENDALQAELETFDSSQLTADQLFTYKFLQDALETEKLSRGLELYYQPLSPLIGTQAQLPTLLAEYTFYDREDVDQYLELLSQIDVYYGQLADYEKERAKAGLAPSDATIDRIIQSCRDYLIRPENSFLTETFSSRLDEVAGLSQEEKEDYKKQHLAIMKEHFIPAYTNLSAALEELKGSCTGDGSLSSYEKGKEYYTYLVASETGTDSSVDELRQRIEKQMGADMAMMARLLSDDPTLEKRLASASVPLSDPIEILNHLQEQIREDFPELQDTSFEVKHVPQALEASLSPAFFLVPPLDYSGPNIIYINDQASKEQNLYTMLAHEGYPGHLYQSVYFNRKNVCPLHRLLACGGYSEGWGLYCELYSYSFDNGLPENVQKVLMYNEAATYGLYALLDIRINYDGWDMAKVSEFLESFYGITDPDVTEEIYLSITDNPVNYLKYYTGYLEIISMRETAEETLGSRYDAKKFHQFILDMNEAPFRIIKPYFQTWLLTY